jgi:hypothetical protein
MKKRKIWAGLAAALLLVSLTACGNQQANSTDSNSSKQTQATSKTTSNENTNQQSSSTSSQQETTLWNKQKDQELAAFINKWAPTMHQSYQEYDGNTPLKTSVGIAYPDGLSREQVDGQSGMMGWAPTGKGNYEYNVVAIYNYDGTEPPLPNRITYFFCFHDGKPVVLVDQTRDGDPSAHPTANQDVQSNFTRIADEK